MQQPRRIIRALQDNIAKVIVGKEEAIEYALIALLCRGHVLIEDVPGVGKTTLASALAKSLDCSFRRIQFTPDLMPSDVTGFTLVNFKTGEMEYKEGAIMSQVILADEINLATHLNINRGRSTALLRFNALIVDLDRVFKRLGAVGEQLPQLVLSF